MLKNILLLSTLVLILGNMAFAQEGWHRLYPYQQDLNAKSIDLIDATTAREGMAALTAIEQDTQVIMALTYYDKKGDVKWTWFISENSSATFVKQGGLTYVPQDSSFLVLVTIPEGNKFVTTYATFLEDGTISKVMVTSSDNVDTEIIATYSEKHPILLRSTGLSQELSILKDENIHRTYDIVLERPSYSVDPSTGMGVLSGWDKEKSVFISLDSLGQVRRSVSYTTDADEALTRPVAAVINDTTEIYAATYIDETHIWLVDESGEAIWTRKFKMPGSNTTNPENIVVKDGNIVLVGSYDDTDGNKRFAMGLDVDGKPTYLTTFKNDVSGDTGLVHSAHNPLNGGSILFSNAINTSADKVTSIINMDKDGLAMCSEFQDIDTLLWAGVKKDTLTVTTSTTTWDKGKENASKIFFQDSSLYDVPVLSIAPEKTRFCIGEEVNEKLDALISGIPDSLQSHKWSTGETTTSIIAKETDKKYKVDITVNYETCYMQCDSVTLTRYMPPQASIQSKLTSGCSADLTLSAGGGKSPYTLKWADDSTEPTIKVTEEKVYSAKVTDACGQEGTATLDLKFPPLTVGIVATEITPCKEVKLQAAVSGEEQPVTYSWSTGETTSSITVTAAGAYTVTVKDGCKKEATASQDVTLNQPITDVNVNHKVTCNEDDVAASTVVFQATPVGGTSRSTRIIDKRDTSKVYTVGATIPLSNYIIEVRDFCGNTIRKEANIGSECGGCISYPKVFFPDGTVKEEQTFGAVDRCGGTEGITDYQFRIYNRWGQEVFSSDKVEGRWDGKIGSSKAPSEVYVYYAKYMLDGEEVLAKGDVTIIR